MKRKNIYYCAVIALLALVSSVSISALAEDYGEVTFTQKELQEAIDNWVEENCLTSERLACKFVIAYYGEVIASGVSRGYHP